MKRGVTLVELLITLVVIGLAAAVATLAIGPVRRPVNDQRAQLMSARHHALAAGRDTTIRFGDSLSATAHPDGSVSADTALHIERLTGAPRE
jgi:prepilin-type N-terminal cleavage/methylation domain-containing protein